jgi:hypothetical protein
MLVRHSELNCPRTCSVRSKPSSYRPTCSPKWRKNPLECPTRAVEWCGHAAYAAHPLASVRHRSWLVTVASSTLILLGSSLRYCNKDNWLRANEATLLQTPNYSSILQQWAGNHRRAADNSSEKGSDYDPENVLKARTITRGLTMLNDLRNDNERVAKLTWKRPDLWRTSKKH